MEAWPLRRHALNRGCDFAGTVESEGPGVTRWRPGDMVFGEADAAIAEYVVASQEVVAAMPSGLTFEQAAAIPRPGNTGEPEMSFVLFALGFLLMAVGGLLRGSQLRKAGAGLSGKGLVAVASLGLLAIAVGSDPWHDLFLLSGYAAWSVVGLGASRSRPARYRDVEAQSA